MKIIIFIVLILILLAVLLPLLNFGETYSFIITSMEFIGDGFEFIGLLLKNGFNIITGGYPNLFGRLVLIFVAVWFVEFIIVHIIGGKE